MKGHQIWKVVGVGLLVCGLANAGTFITFDAPGAGTGFNQGTFPQSINPAGEITGHYCDAIGCHGFLRAPDGTFTTFDAPDDVNGTYPSSISTAGAITGGYCDAITCHGFLRALDGTFTTFDAPDDVYGTGGSSISPASVITGSYTDENFVAHGFVRTRDGTLTTFDVPSAGTGSFQGTSGAGMNPQGVVSGCYTDANYLSHGFLRTKDGTFTTFDVPGSTNLGRSCGGGIFAFSGTPSLGINPAGAITGTYFQPIAGNPFGGNFRGFVRAPDGSFTTFDAVPSPSSPCCTWTFGIAINPAGAIAGWLNDFRDLNRGFLRAVDGTITLLDAPGAGTHFGFFQGTIADAINPAGRITGWYWDANHAVHGYLWIP